MRRLLGRWLLRRGRHARGRPLVEAPAPDVSVSFSVPVPVPVPPVVRVQLGFKDGTIATLDPRSESARALQALATALNTG